MNGVTLVDGLRLRGNSFQADLRRWGRGQPTLRLPGRREPITDPDIANRTYLELCAAYEAEARAIANGEAPPLPDVAAQVREAERLHPRNYVPAYMEARYATSGLTKSYLDAQAHRLQRIFEETSFADLTSIQQIDRRRVADLCFELTRMRLAHPAPYPDSFSTLRDLDQAAAQEAFDREHNMLKPASIRQFLMSLSSLISHAIDVGDYDRPNPISRHKSVPKQPGPLRADDESSFLTIDEVRRMLDVFSYDSGHERNPYGYEMFAILVYTGMRIGELFRMRPWDIDFDGRRVLVYGTKTDASRFRVVPLWPALERILRPFFEREGLLANPRKRPLLFPGRPRKGRSGEVKMQPRQDMTRLLKRVAREAGVTKPVHQHMTRHTYISVRLQMVEDVRGMLVNVTKHTITREVGHSGERTIDLVYGHVQPGRYAMVDLDYAIEPELNPRVTRPTAGSAA